MTYYETPITKLNKEIRFSVGKSDKEKKFHVIFVAKGIQIPLPKSKEGKIKDMAFDFSCGIKAATIEEVSKEIQQLLAKGYVEEEAPPGI